MAYFPTPVTCQNCGRVADLREMTGSVIKEEFFCPPDAECWEE